MAAIWPLKKQKVEPRPPESEESRLKREAVRLDKAYGFLRYNTVWLELADGPILLKDMDRRLAIVERSLNGRVQDQEETH